MSEATPTVDAPSTPPIRFRRTRIGVSVFFGVLTVALCVLWVRSYWWLEHFRGPGLRSGSVNLWSGDGRLTFQVNRKPSLEWNVAVYPYPEGWERRQWLWGWYSNANETLLAFPYWLPSLIFALLAASITVHRFSLRTMLIATTLMAVVLGLGVWLAR